MNDTNHSTPAPPNWKGLLAAVLGAGIGISLLVWLLTRFDLGAVRSAFLGMDKRALPVIILLVLLSMALRAWRWRWLVGTNSGPFEAYWSALMTGYLANNILPARSGDLLRVLWLGAATGISRSLLLGTVLVERLVDLLSTVLVLSIALMLAPLPLWLQRTGIHLGAAAVAAAFVLWAYGRWGERLNRLVGPLLRLLPQWLAQRVERALGGLQVGLRTLLRLGTAAKFLLVSLLLWCIELLIAWLFAWALGIPLQLPEAVIVTVFTGFSAMLPSLPGQLGVFEAAAVSGMQWLGHTGDTVLAFALGWHLTLLLTTSVLGVICMMTAGRLGLAPGRLLRPTRVPLPADGLPRP